MLNKNREKLTLSRILYFIVLIILIIVAIKLFNKYINNNFNDFILTEYIPYTSEFSRDSEVKYSKMNSYKISSPKVNDAMFFKSISVTPNTPYKVTCMVKTENVKTLKEVSSAGAHISIADTVEKSESVTGTTDWQKLEFIFNSKNRTSVNLGFRLGGYDDNCTGTAWFSDFSIEEGSETLDNNWNFACFIIKNTDVEVEKNGQKNHIRLNMSNEDITDMKQNMSRFKTACEQLSNNKMKVSYDVITIDEPITSLSYDTENGYFVAPENVKKVMKPYLTQKDYDHIYICVRLGDNEHQKDIPVYDWIGLGGMDYLGIGFSNIRLPNSSGSYTYKYNASINTFPEEVFIHEFLHTLERNCKEYGYERPELHDYANYGYKDEKIIGLKKWYEDYMNCEIKTSSGYIGLNSNVFKLKPNHEEDFKFSLKLDEFDEPSNIFEQIKMLITKAFNNANNLIMHKKENS